MKIIEVKALDHFRLRLRFDDNVAGVADLGHLAGRGVFQIWRAPGVFEQVALTPTGALEWPGEIDLCPDSLYFEVTGKKPEEVFPALKHRLSHA